MVALNTQPGLGMGLYTPAQAAYLARVPVQTVVRWLFDRPGAPAPIRRQLEAGPDEDRLVTFLDLVQAMAVRSIRRTQKIPLHKLRAFIQTVEREYNISYPFARHHQTYLFDGEIVLRHGEQYIEITGKYKGQPLIREVVELYMQDLAFDPASGLANRYVALRDRFTDQHILIDPARRFGQPLVMPSGYSVAALLQSVRAEGSTRAAAVVNGIDESQVILAQRYDDLLAGVAA